MKKVLLLFAVCCMGVSSLNAQSDYKKWLKSEKKDATYTRKEIKKAAKEYAELIYEDAKEVFKERDNFADKSVKKKEKFMMDEFAGEVLEYRDQRYKVADNLPSLEDQVEADVRSKWSFDADLFPTNISGEAKCVAKTYELATNKAYDMARENLANEIMHEITMQFARKDFVKRFGVVKAQEMVQAILDTKTGLLELISDVQKVLEIYNSKNLVSSEVFVRIYYSGIQAKADFKAALKDLLKNDSSLYNEMTYFLDTAKEK
ncbi:MAG: hypothetical protein IJ069_05975 [Prevotella sp.]|nr:hypothetical protein [Prevotella sp.]